MSLRTAASAGLLGLLALCPAQAFGHGVPHGTGTLRLNGDRVFSVLSFPVSQLTRGDDDGDGRLSRGELERHRQDITAVVRERLRVESGFDRGEVMFEDLLLPHAEDGGGDLPPATHLGVMRSTRFSHAVTAPRLVAQVFDGPEAGSQFHATFLDERGEPLDRATLSARVPSWRFGAGPAEVARLHAAGAAGWLVRTPLGWLLLGAALASGALLRRRPRWVVAGATGSGGALLLSRALAAHAAFGREFPHTLAAGLGSTAVLGACAVAALGLGLGWTGGASRGSTPGPGSSPPA
jgi:hypothetical protein